MPGHHWYARRCGAFKKDGGICYGRAFENGRCKFHSGMVTPYHERPISEEGKRRIGAAATLRWQRYREAKAAGCVPYKTGRPPKPKREPVKPPRPTKETVLTPEDLSFARSVGMMK